MSETVESLRQQALAIGVELAIALYGETPHPAQRGRYDREVAEATAIIDAFEAAAKREGVREFLAQEPSGEWLAGEGESSAGTGEGVWHTDWPEESKALCWFDYSEQDTDDEELAVVRAKAKARAVANALNALAKEGENA